MPECFIRYSVADQTIYEAAFRPIETLTAGEAVASIGLRGQVPDARVERYDGANGLRPATAPEVTAYDQARAAEAERNRFDGDLMLMALARWTAQKVVVAPATARSEILAIYRTLRG